MPAQPPLAPLPAIGFQMQVQLFPTVRTRNRNYEVPSRIADQAFDLPLIVAPGWTAELIGEQIVTLQLGESTGPLPLFAAQDLRYRDLGVVIKYPCGHAAEVCKGPHMAFKKSFRRLGRKGRHKAVV